MAHAMRPVRALGAAALFIMVLSPFAALAQTASTTPVDSAGTTPSERQQLHGWRQSSEFQQKIDALGSTATSAVFMPVLFGVEVRDISPNFGDPRDGGARTHEGEDIMAVKGTPVVSPTSAVVLRTVMYAGGGGNTVYTANPGGETFVYMHLDRFGEGVVSGAVLSQGSLIGYVGNTGNASGGAAHLHFEIHNSSGTPTDPYPRLTAEFSIQEKISYLAAILTQTSDRTALARFLVTNFRGVFIAALAANISLPLPILDAIASIPPATVATGTGTASVSLPAGDLDIGSSGAAVTVLQQYLIRSASGVAASRLAVAGATGYFGIITKAAVVEFQVAAGIAPPSGYYGASTRAFIAGHPLGTVSPPESGHAIIPTAPGSAGSGGAGTPTLTLTRNLYRGVSGQDVLELQQFLNTHGFAVAASDAGSLGEETTYFGAATEAAVIRFQTAKAIAPAVGYVGPLTRTALGAQL